MSEFIKPRFQHTTVCEALLVKSDVERYAETHNISFDEAVEVLGREYVHKYERYCVISGTRFEYLGQ